MTPFTLVHELISLVGIASSVVVALGLLGGRRLGGWTVLFLTTTIATSLTGFGFPFDHLLPAHVIGLVSIAVLAVALIARYPMRLVGWWRPVYVVSAMIALYLNVFVLIVQLFRKVPAARPYASRAAAPDRAVHRTGAVRYRHGPCCPQISRQRLVRRARVGIRTALQVTAGMHSGMTPAVTHVLPRSDQERYPETRGNIFLGILEPATRLERVTC